MAYNSFPYTNMHELNLDYLLNKSKEVQANVEASAGSASAAASSATAAANSANASLTYSRNSANSAAASEASAADSAESARIAAAAAGDPVTFTAASQLTNTSKIYVYIGETGTYTYGHWYYYANDVWVDGGVYGTWTTDATLSLSGVAADAKATGDEINGLKSSMNQTYDYLSDVRFTTIVPNILDPNTYTQGVITSIVGNTDSNPDWRTTDFLLIKNDTDPIYCSFAYPAFRYIWYTEPNKNAHIGDYNSETVYGKAITPVSGAKYIRLSYVVISGDTTRDYSKQYISYDNKYEPFNQLPLADAVSDLQAKMDQVITKNLPNLLDPDTYTSGYISSISGNISSSADWRTTDFLELTEPTNPVYVNLGYPAFRCIFYSEPDKAAHVGDYISETVSKKTLTPPTGAKYIRLSYVVTNGNYDYSKQYISNYDQYVPFGEDTYSAGETYLDVIAETVKSENPFASIKIVSPDGKGNYTTISDAVDDAVDGDVVYVLPGEYYEAVHVERKHISIIGFSKKDCVLWNDFGDYAECPLWMTSGYLKNMTIKAVQKDEDAGKTSNIPYCVHIDMKYPTDANLRDFEIDNCDFISDWSDCLGCGTAQNATLIVRNCYLENTAKSFRYPFAYHNTTSASQAKILLDNNRLINKGTGAYCIYLYDYDTAQSLVDVELIGNTCKSAVNGVLNANFVLNANNHDMFSLENTSHGNNLSNMNYT